MAQGLAQQHKRDLIGGCVQPCGVSSFPNWVARAGSTGVYLLFLFNTLQQQHSHYWLNMDANATHWGRLHSSGPHRTMVCRIENGAALGMEGIYKVGNGS